MAKLTSEQLKALPDSMFGLPKERKYPMPDKEHVIKAIQFFRYCPDKDKPELAKNINKKAKEYGLKVKVQTSSPFYKYADKDILKEGLIVISEFHIGQLSPIVGYGAPPVEKPSFNTKPNMFPMDRLKKVWDSNKSIKEKNHLTVDLVKEAILNNPRCISSEAFRHIQEVYELNYMLNENETSFKEITNEFIPNFYNLQARVNDMDSILYNKIINNSNTMTPYELEETILSIRSSLVRSAAIAYISLHHDEINDDKIRDIISKIGSRELYCDNSIERQNISSGYMKSVNFTDEQIEIVDSIIRICSLPYVLENIAYSLFLKKGIEAFHSFNIGTLTFITDFISNSCIEGKLGYYIKDTVDNYSSKFINIFFRRDNDIYYILAFTNRYNKYEKYGFFVKVYDDNDEEYNNNMLAYISGAKIKFNIKTFMVTSNIKPTVSLEYNNFTDTYRGLQIDSNGNISFLFGADRSWSEKVRFCETALKRNESNKDYDKLINNLCFLFALICDMRKKYIESKSFPSSGYDDITDAHHAINIGIDIFRKYIYKIGKVKRKFVFPQYYYEIGYNSKIHIFDPVYDGIPVKDSINRAYISIMR